MRTSSSFKKNGIKPLRLHALLNLPQQLDILVNGIGHGFFTQNNGLVSKNIPHGPVTWLIQRRPLGLPDRARLYGQR